MKTENIQSGRQKIIFDHWRRRRTEEKNGKVGRVEIEGTTRGPCGPKKNVAMHGVTFTKCGQINFCLSAAQSLFINNSRQGNESK